MSLENSNSLRHEHILQSTRILYSQNVLIQKVQALNKIAHARGQSMAQMALAWVLKDKRITSVLIGASSVQQINDNVETLRNLVFLESELEAIESILN